MLVFLTLTITLRSWRDAKRSPYFFLRRQAAKKMQQYALVSLGLIVLTLATTAYAWQEPVDAAPRSALLTHAKPLLEASVEAGALAETRPVADGVAAPERIEITMSPASRADAEIVSVPLAADPSELLAPQTELPEEYDQYEPTEALSEDTRIADLSFSTEITGDYEPVGADSRFVGGYFTLYGTFAYEGMKNGMVWSWVWRHNGQAVDGGNQVWSYGDDGPGYVYLRPEEGFDLGSYVLEVWVNGEVMAQSSFVVGDGVAANQ